MARFMCRNCRDHLALIDDRWIHLNLPIGQAWNHAVDPVEAGSGDDPGGARAGVPNRPHPHSPSNAAAAELTTSEGTTYVDAVGRPTPRKGQP